MHRHDVGVAEVRQDSRLPKEALGSPCGGEFRPDDLNSYTPVERYVPREKDDAHTAAGELALYFIIGA
jgi:hypothetical protein